MRTWLTRTCLIWLPSILKERMASHVAERQQWHDPDVALTITCAARNTTVSEIHPCTRGTDKTADSRTSNSRGLHDKQSRPAAIIVYKSRPPKMGQKLTSYDGRRTRENLRMPGAEISPGMQLLWGIRKIFRYGLTKRETLSRGQTVCLTYR